MYVILLGLEASRDTLPRPLLGPLSSSTCTLAALVVLNDTHVPYGTTLPKTSLPYVHTFNNTVSTEVPQVKYSHRPWRYRKFLVHRFHLRLEFKISCGLRWTLCPFLQVDQDRRPTGRRGWTPRTLT